MTEKDEKSKSVEDLKPGEQCGPSNLDDAPLRVPDEAVAASYPSKNPKYSYNYETPTHKILVMAADGHHAPDRWDLTQDDPGSSVDPQHEHDDFKRLPPTVLQDADPKDARIGFFAQYRVPDSRDELTHAGDRLGPTPEQRAKKPNSQLTDNSVPRQLSDQ